MKPISPLDCDHMFTRQFIQSSGGTPLGDVTLAPDRHNVQVCRRCGQFQIFAEKSGVAIEVNFTLCIQEQLYAAGQYKKYLDASDD